MVAIFPASTKASGNCFALPDTCLTPAPPAPSPVPLPYPNTGMLNQASKVATKVKFSNKYVVTMNSEIPRTMGDEAGINKGVMSGMNMGKLLFKTGSNNILIEGHACIRLTSMAGHNGMSANMPAGTQVAPSQNKVIVAP